MTENPVKTKNWLFNAGVILVVFWSAITGFFNIAILYFFGIPILGLLLGIILVWIAKENIKTKILFSLIPIPIILVAFLLFYVLLPKAEPETFLIPQNFRG